MIKVTTNPAQRKLAQRVDRTRAQPAKQQLGVRTSHVGDVDLHCVARKSTRTTFSMPARLLL